MASNNWVVGMAAIVGGTMTRPADTTAYSIGDLVANSVTAGSVVPFNVPVFRRPDSTSIIRRVRLKVNDAAWTTASAVIRVHFYQMSPTPVNGDNGAFSTTESNYIGSVDVTFNRAFSDPFSKGIGVSNDGSELICDAINANQSVFALLETRTAVTPASAVTFSLGVEVLQN